MLFRSLTLFPQGRGEGEGHVLATGTSIVAPSSSLTTLDPATLSNGFYTLHLMAEDVAGRSAVTDTTIEINSGTKSHFLRAETDLTVTLAGETVDIVRQYDSLSMFPSPLGGEGKGEGDTFGFGWRLANRDFNLEANVPATGREESGVFDAFRNDTRLYLTLPSGDRVGFTFAPEQHDIPGLTYFTPAFVADAGMDWTLEGSDAKLIKAGDQFFHLLTSEPYNPVSGEPSPLGGEGSGEGAGMTNGAFALISPDGTRYLLDGAGRVQEEIRPSGVKFRWSDKIGRAHV